jgi:protein TonB
MIRYKVNRKVPTGNGMFISTVLHALLLLLLVFQAGRQMAGNQFMDELTEIAYIEAHYGEDVAAKVKLKTLPLRDPGLKDPGRGVSSESAIKPESPSSEPPRTEPKPAVAEVEAPAIELDKPELLAQADQLQAKTPPQNDRPIVDTSKLQGGKLQAADTASPQAVAPASTEAFKPKSASLQSKGSKIIITDKPLPAASSGARQMKVAEASTNLSGGGLRGGGGTQTYQAPSAALKPSSAGRSKGGSGVVDVVGPKGGGGSEKGARRTILDYGSGSGGRGGSLAGRRPSLADGVNSRAIVEGEASQSDQKSSVAEVKMDGKGVSMTISGQISGRKILHSVVPKYTERAKRNGWEGAVAVHFTVLADGRVKDNMYFDQTSAHRDLNQAAMAAIKQFRFAPLPADKATVEQWGVITIIFRLN